MEGSMFGFFISLRKVKSEDRKFYFIKIYDFDYIAKKIEEITLSKLTPLSDVNIVD